jgi:uncharacterized protein
MSDFNSQCNRVVWFDVPVRDLDRAANFYASVLNVRVNRESFEGCELGVIEHHEGNGGCLVPGAEEIAAGGVLIYLNVDGRIREAVSQVLPHGGTVIKPIHAISPHGFRALILDSEGNRVALHSNADV